MPNYDEILYEEFVLSSDAEFLEEEDRRIFMEEFAFMERNLIQLDNIFSEFSNQGKIHPMSKSTPHRLTSIFK